MDEDAGIFKRILKSFEHQEGLDDLLAMSEHPNGHKRENAVRRLGVLGNPLAIPNLLVRANDWVPQVRSEAREALLRLLKGENAQAFIYNLPALHHLHGCRRTDHSELIASVNNFFLRPENVAHIKSAIKSEAPYIARIAVKLCIDNSLLDKSSLVSECLSHQDVVVRALASNLLRDLTGEDLEAMLQKSIHDPFMPIRREAFQIYLERFPAKGLRLAIRMLFDRHASIRDIAIARLLNKGQDLEKIFADVLSSINPSGLKLRCAIFGVASMRATSLIPTVKKLASHQLPSVRKASLQAMARLAEVDARLYLLAGLRDESPSVAKESISLLSKAAFTPTLEELVNVVKDISYVHTLTVCLDGARTLNKWDRLIFILRLYPTLLLDRRSSSEQFDIELEKWDVDFNRSSSQPTNDQRAQIGELYGQHGQLFSDAKRRSLEFTLRGF